MLEWVSNAKRSWSAFTKRRALTSQQTPTHLTCWSIFVTIL